MKTNWLVYCQSCGQKYEQATHDPPAICGACGSSDTPPIVKKIRDKRVKVRKRVLQITILYPDDYVWPDDEMDMLEDMSGGETIGGFFQEIKDEPVKDEDLVRELQAIGDDGTFFDDWLDSWDEDEDDEEIQWK